jgi:hypothetical protein
LEALYQGGAVVDGDREWFRKHRIALVEVPPEELVGVFENPAAPPPGMIAEALPGQSNEDAIDGFTEAPSDLSCEGPYKHEEQEVMTVLAWPEFMVVWRPSDVRIGCTTVRFWLPVLLSRSTEQVLYVVVSYPGVGTDQTAKQIFMECALGSALTGGVVGYVTVNPAAGYSAFVALFEACIIARLTRYITCLVPQLKIVERSSDWA